MGSQSPEPAPAASKADLSRSRSPGHEERKPKKKFTGLKYKDKKSTNTEDDRARYDDRGLKRGYRERSPRRDSYRDRSPRRDDYRDRPPRRDNYRNRSPRRDKDRDGGAKDVGRGSDNYRPTRDQVQQPEQSDLPPTRPPAAATPIPTTAAPKSSSNKSKKPKFVAPAEPMIIVNINDRLGTKAAIPCLASDSIKAFKAIVAANIGRQPHEIMLKRQGERPFKDALTLADYGVSSGVQLDLEIDTGD